MIYKPKGRDYYVVDFQWHGKRIQRRTQCTNRRDALAIEAAIRSELERGNYGILSPKPKPILADFLKDGFLPYVKTQFQTKPNTRLYYEYGAKSLLDSDLAQLRLDEITGQHVTGYIAQHAHFKPTTVNRDLRTLRRAVALAVEWGKIGKPAKIILAKGERQRERVLTEGETTKYLKACPQPWRDVATIMVGEGMRPGEIYCLRWEHVLLGEESGLIQVAKGKSKAARRPLPMIPSVYQALKARHEAQGCPAEGWVFPTGAVSGHIEESSAKKWHAKALRESGVTAFEPYCLRHTFGTRMAPKCDVFALARIMGHSSIAVTQKYVHPQAEAIESAFAKMVEQQEVPTSSTTRTDALPVGRLDSKAK